MDGFPVRTVLISPAMEIPALILEKTLDAMHWVICPYTSGGEGKSLSIASLEDYPHILELTQAYNDLAEIYNSLDLKYAYESVSYV